MHFTKAIISSLFVIAAAAAPAPDAGAESLGIRAANAADAVAPLDDAFDEIFEDVVGLDDDDDIEDVIEDVIDSDSDDSEGGLAARSAIEARGLTCMWGGNVACVRKV